MLINNREYEVSFKDEVVANGSDTNWGALSYGEKKIVIKSGLSNVDKMETLMHEIAHGIMRESGISYLFNVEQQEAICEIAVNTYRIIKDYKLPEMQRAE